LPQKYKYKQKQKQKQKAEAEAHQGYINLQTWLSVLSRKQTVRPL